jgi:transposase
MAMAFVDEAAAYVKDNGAEKALAEFNIPRSTYYKWKKAFDKEGEKGLMRKHPVAFKHPNKIKEEIIAKVLSLRRDYQLGSWRIKWYLERYHNIQISESSVTRILKNSELKNFRRKLPGGHCIPKDIAKKLRGIMSRLT